MAKDKIHKRNIQDIVQRVRERLDEEVISKFQQELMKRDENNDGADFQQQFNNQLDQYIQDWLKRMFPDYWSDENDSSASSHISSGSSNSNNNSNNNSTGKKGGGSCSGNSSQDDDTSDDVNDDDQNDDDNNDDDQNEDD